MKSAISFKLYPVLVLILSSLLVGKSQAILVRHDTTDSSYRVVPAEFPQVFYLHESRNRKICIATLVSSEWALTAAHCAYETPLAETLNSVGVYPVKVGRLSAEVDRLVVHPGFSPETSSFGEGVDLALLHLAEPLPVKAINLYTGNEEAGVEAIFVGWGYTGSGLTGRQKDDGKFRRAQNRVEQAGRQLIFRFDNPAERPGKALRLEGVPGMGDSGGPAILERPDGRFLIGVARGERTTDSDSQQGLYGANTVYERVSLHTEWLQNVISAQ